MLKHFKSLSSEIKKKFIKKNSLVIELGCNDGIFLKNFKNYNHLGIEPSKNVAKEASKNGINVITKFFSYNLSKEILNSYGNADLIYSANVMCHLPNINDVGKGISNLLNDRGLLIFEDPYIGDVIEKPHLTKSMTNMFFSFLLIQLKIFFLNLI